MDEKVISEILESKYDGKDLARYLAFSLALRDFYQSLHWGTFGDSFYEDHLLYERLYNEISEEVDGIAEKFVGLHNSEVVCPIQLSRMRCDIYENLISEFSITGDPIGFYEFSLFLEKSFLKISEVFYEELESKGLLTLGLDDLLASVYSKHEDNIYLLKQKFLAVKVRN